MIWCEEQSFLAQPEQMPPMWLLIITDMHCSKVLKAWSSNPRVQIQGWAPWKLSVKVDPGLMASMLLLQLLLAAGEPWHFLFTYLSLPLSSSDLLFHVSPFSYEDLSLVASCPSLQDDFILRFLHQCHLKRPFPNWSYMNRLWGCVHGYIIFENHYSISSHLWLPSMLGSLVTWMNNFSSTITTKARKNTILNKSEDIFS